jgi:D-glycero-D-manno-heptose 1,7-bisphosphate phosphatase
MKAKALFLDRDGVINIDHGYVHRKEDCVFVDGIFDLVRAANEAGYRVIVVTNQAGIARGYYSDAAFHAFMQWMQDQFARRGATIDHVYYCPHHPDAGSGALRIACACRKPAPGMLETACAEFDLDMAASLLVGDKESDIEAARRAGVGRSFLLSETESQSACRITSLATVAQAL